MQKPMLQRLIELRRQQRELDKAVKEVEAQAVAEAQELANGKKSFVYGDAKVQIRSRSVVPKDHPELTRLFNMIETKRTYNQERNLDRILELENTIFHAQEEIKNLKDDEEVQEAEAKLKELTDSLTETITSIAITL